MSSLTGNKSDSTLSQKSSSISKDVDFKLSICFVVFWVLFPCIWALFEWAGCSKQFKPVLIWTGEVQSWCLDDFVISAPHFTHIFHSKNLSRHLKPQILPELSTLPILLFYHFLTFNVYLDVGWNIWDKGLALVSMLYPTTLFAAPQG